MKSSIPSAIINPCIYALVTIPISLFFSHPLIVIMRKEKQVQHKKEAQSAPAADFDPSIHSQAMMGKQITKRNKRVTAFPISCHEIMTMTDPERIKGPQKEQQSHP
jgi:hypothetical protein